MKKLLITFSLLLVCTLSFAQEGQAEQAVLERETYGPEADAKSDEFIDLWKEEEFAKGIATLKEVVELLKAQPNQTDSLQARQYNFMGVCYNRLTLAEQAVEYHLKALDTYHQAYTNDTCEFVANIYDNISHYLLSLKRYQEAEEYSKRSLEIYYKLMPNNDDFTAVLMHAADCAFYLEKYADAEAYMEHVLRLVSELHGIHSKKYLNELEFLITIEKEIGNADKQKTFEDLHERLENEMEYGYLRETYNFTSADMCRENYEDAYYLCKYYTKHYVELKQGEAISQVIFQFMTNSDMILADIGKAESKLMEADHGILLFGAYMAGVLMKQLEDYDGEQHDTYESYLMGYAHLVDFYVNNQKTLGKIKEAEKYLKAFKKGEDKFMELVRKNFDENQAMKTEAEQKQTKQAEESPAESK